MWLTQSVVTFLYDGIYFSTRVERLSRGLVSHTCTDLFSSYCNVEADFYSVVN